MKIPEVIIEKWDNYGSDDYRCPYCNKYFKTYQGAENCLKRCEKKRYADDTE